MAYKYYSVIVKLSISERIFGIGSVFIYKFFRLKYSVEIQNLIIYFSFDKFNEKNVILYLIFNLILMLLKMILKN